MSNYWHTTKPLVYRNTMQWIGAHWFIKELEDGITTEFEETASGTVLSTGSTDSTTHLGWPVLAVGDTWSFLWAIPSDCEINGALYDIWFYPVCWIDAAAESGDISTWKCQYTIYDGINDVLATPATATATAATGNVNWSVDDALTRAQTGIKMDVSADANLDSTTKYLGINIECDAVTNMTVTELTFMGVEIVYNVPQT